jgi:hypothetical protein
VEAQPTPGPQGYAQPYGAASFPMQPAGRRRKTWDLIFTIILLVVGFFGAGIGVLYGVAFTNPQLLDQALQQQGYGGFSGSAGSAPAILIVSHILLYLVALGGSIPLLISKRVAFWLPLSIGVLAAIIFWATVVGVLLSDPSFVQPGR